MCISFYADKQIKIEVFLHLEFSISNLLSYWGNWNIEMFFTWLVH